MLATLDADDSMVPTSVLTLVDHTALSIFFRLQVDEFDIRFLFLVSHVV